MMSPTSDVVSGHAINLMADAFPDRSSLDSTSPIPTRHSEGRSGNQITEERTVREPRRCEPG